MKKLLFGAVLLLLSGAILTGNSGWCAEGRQKVYFVSTDFPPESYFEGPSPATSKAVFFNALKQELAETQFLEFTSDREEADYRVLLRCSGVTHCDHVKVYLQTMDRQNLASYSIPLSHRVSAKETAGMPLIAKQIAGSLSQQVAEIQDSNLVNVRYMPVSKP
jgi:hypothetical protein